MFEWLSSAVVAAESAGNFERCKPAETAGIDPVK